MNKKIQKLMNKRIQKQYTLSIFFPSRKRIKNLKSTIDSFLSLADPDLFNFEILIKLDFDDTESIEYIKNISNEVENITFVINSRLRGWFNLVDFFEDLIRLAKGKYVFGVNDDVVITTKNWNRILEDKLKEFKIYYPKTEWAPEPNGFLHTYQEAFPIFPKKLIEIWGGQLCPHNNTDSWFTTICDKIQLYPWNVPFRESIDDVLINHTPLDDQLYKDKLETVPINHSLRDYHMNSAEIYHCINLIVEHIKYLDYKSYKEMNIINNYKNNTQN